MKQGIALTLAALIGLGSAQIVQPAHAQDAPPPPPPAGDHHPGPPPGGPGSPGPHGGHFFEEADTNKDGFLTKDEMRAVQDKKLDEMFTHVDTNKDGKLSKEELKQGREDMRKRMQQRFKEHKASEKSE